MPASDGTRQFAQDLFDKLPGKSSSNGRPPVAPANQRVQDAAARAFVRQNAQYSLLVDDDEDEDAAPDLPAPTTAPLPKKREKKLRKDKAGVRCAAARHCTYWQPWCKHACAHTCGLAGSPYSLAGMEQKHLHSRHMEKHTLPGTTRIAGLRAVAARQPEYTDMSVITCSGS